MRMVRRGVTDVKETLLRVAALKQRLGPGTLDLERSLRRTSAAAGAALLLLLAALIVIPFPVDELTPPPSTWVTDSRGGTLRVYVNGRGDFHRPVTLDEVSPFLISSTITFEDRFFRWHPGINPLAVARAALQNLEAGEVVSGGSTLTQQVARLMDPRPRTLTAKVVEAFRALQLELRCSKEEILTHYFNLAPYGGNLVGVGAAAWAYFGRAPSELSPGEAALLSALPNNPSLLRPDRHPRAARARRDEVLRRMRARDIIGENRFRNALAESVPDRRRPLPMGAPHVGDMMRASRGADGGRVVTCIDPEIQDRVERLLARHLLGLEGRGVGNGAVVVIENESRSVRALAGSADYHDPKSKGQVNGALAARSPGSTLKPFAYALAMDDRLISPSTLLEDVPVSYAGYTPQNYDGGYRGYVTASEALSRSMNVPAVNLLQRLGMGRFFDFLQRSGVSTLDEARDHYGLSLILGGGGFSLLELTNLYATLARAGGYRPPRILEEDPTPSERPVLSPGAAYIVTEMLTEVRRPDFPSAWENALHVPSLAWKTGTSYGHRDAWSVGYTPRYTIGVWLGNFDGSGSRALVGAEAAGPLLFDLATSLEPGGGSVFPRPDGVEKRLVCSLSGLPPGPGCPHVQSELYLPGVSPTRTCDLHVQFEVDDATGHRLCPACRVGRNRHVETRVVWPAGMAGWLKANGHAVPEIPEHLPGCVTLASGPGPQIRSPVRGVTYILREGIPLEDQRIRLEASAASSVRTIYWFVDGEMVSQGPPEEPAFLDPSEGQHEVVCMDDEGRTTRTVMVVREPSHRP